MKEKMTIIEILKEQEQLLNALALVRGFSINIDLDKNNSDLGVLTVYCKKGKITYLYKFNIEKIFDAQINIKINNTILEKALFSNNLITWLFNFIYYDCINFLYRFFGGKYNNRIMEKEELEKECNFILRIPTREEFFSERTRCKSQPKINGYLKPRFSHMESGLIYFDYESLEYRQKLK